MSEKWLCPDCHQKAVEKVQACGASNYFCTNCKKLISSKRVEEENKS